LRLAENVTNLTGTLLTAPLTQSQLAAHIRKETSLLQAGYSQDKAHILTVHEGCRFIELGLGSRLIFHTCDAVKGDSGSPILVRNGDRYQLIAIHVATLLTGRKTLGVAIPGMSFHATIENSQSANK
jgi:protease YdgD